MNIDDGFSDYNAGDEFSDCKAHARDHVQAAQNTLRLCIRHVTNARLDSGSLAGRTLDDLLDMLIETEGDLSRADGELAD